MSESADDLRATRNDIKADADRLREIEDEKAKLDAADPRAAALSEEAAQIARRLVPKTVAEKEMVDEAEKE